MLQDMDNMEVSCPFCVKVDMLNQFEHSQIWLVTVNKAGIVRLTLPHALIVSVSFMYYPGDLLRQKSAEVISLVECPMNI